MWQIWVDGYSGDTEVSELLLIDEQPNPMKTLFHDISLLLVILVSEDTGIMLSHSCLLHFLVSFKWINIGKIKFCIKIVFSGMHCSILKRHQIKFAYLTELVP